MRAGSGQNVIGPRGGRAGADDAVKAARSAAKADPTLADAKRQLTVCLYSNGFTVQMAGEGEGELRAYEAPENVVFMTSLNSGRVPEELTKLPAVRNGSIGVELSDKRKEEYVPPPYRAYGGTGAPTGAIAAPTTAVVRGTGAGAKSVVVDASAPTLRLQVKLANGKKEALTLNMSHTVGDLQAMVAALNGTGGKPFMLLAGVPPKPLDMAAATVEAAGLRNASVSQVIV